MTVGSDGKNALDVGANPTISTKLVDSPRNLFYTEREWSRLVGWGNPPEGMNSFDRASSTQTDSPKDD